jgi:hypothetical protein
MLLLGNSKTDSTQPHISEIIPYGYLYLLILGIAAESIYYGVIGINFLSYASILDVLLGPVAILTDNILLFAILIGLGIIFYLFLLLVNKVQEKKQSDKRTMNLLTSWLLFMSMAVFWGFVGYGYGGALSEKERIENNNIEHNLVVHFINGESKEVRKLGNTGGYLFYIEKGQKKTSVSPIHGTILSMTSL